MSPPPPGAAGAGFFSGFSAITASVVRNSPAMEAAFCSAERVTFAGSIIPAVNRIERPHLLGHHAALQAGVDRDLLERLLQCPAHDGSAGRLVAREIELLERVGARLEQGHAATGDDALLDRGLGVAHRVLDAVLALLELHLGG